MPDDTITELPRYPMTSQLRRMDPVDFLDAGHRMGEIFTYNHLQFLAAAAITERLVDTPAQRERTRRVVLEMPDPPRDPQIAAAYAADPEHRAVRQWHNAIVSDDAFGDRVAAALPDAIRDEALATADRWLHSLTFTPGETADDEGCRVCGDEGCRVCGEIITGSYVHIATRLLDAEDPGDVCAACIIEAAETVGGFGMGVDSRGVVSDEPGFVA